MSTVDLYSDRMREDHTGVDPTDFEVGKRHDLEEINVMNDDATINEWGGKLCRHEQM